MASGCYFKLVSNYFSTNSSINLRIGDVMLIGLKFCKSGIFSGTLFKIINLPVETIYGIDLV